MAKPASRKTKTKFVGVKLDEQTFSRLEEQAQVKGYDHLSDALRDCINGVSGELENEVRSLRQDNKDIRQELKEIRLLLRDVLPQLMTKKETQDNFDAVGRILDVVLKKVINK
jgi:hypothetical protein